MNIAVLGSRSGVVFATEEVEIAFIEKSGELEADGAATCVSDYRVP